MSLAGYPRGLGTNVINLDENYGARTDYLKVVGTFQDGKLCSFTSILIKSTRSISWCLSTESNGSDRNGHTLSWFSYIRLAQTVASRLLSANQVQLCGSCFLAQRALVNSNVLQRLIRKCRLSLFLSRGEASTAITLPSSPTFVRQATYITRDALHIQNRHSRRRKCSTNEHSTFSNPL